jgi:ABC-type nitrate/sulfonate/bicarbonate transport system substrate-binding protein
LLLLVSTAFGCRPAGPAPEAAPPRQAGPPLEPVQVVYVAKTAALLPYWVAREDGAFARNGLSVEFQQLPDADTAYTYLVTSAAHVYLTPLDTALIARAANGTDLALLGGQPDLAMVTLRPLVATREPIMERFLRGVLEGIHTVQTRPETGRALLAREGLPAPPDGADPAPLERVPYLSADDLAPLIAAGASADPRAAALDPNRLLDQNVLRRLEASGFVAALYRA